MSGLRAGRAALALAALAVSPGCVAAAVPALAGGVVARQIMTRDDTAADPQDARAVEQVPSGNTRITIVQGATELPPPDAVTQTALSGAPASENVPQVPAGMRFLYGSGESAALSYQAYDALWDYVEQRTLDHELGRPVAGVVLAPDAQLEQPRFLSCGDKPLAVVFDIDETVLLNTGYEADDARRGTGYDAERWSRWEATGGAQVEVVPGAAETIGAIRGKGVAVVFNSNRTSANAAATAATLRAAGLGEAEHGDTLWLKGDAPDGSAKDARRQAIAERYCVIALVGDQLGDFSDLFDAGDPDPRVRRNRAASTMIAPLWGTGWFLLPNPVYGSSVAGGYDEIFPQSVRWNDPAEESDDALVP